MIIKSAEKHFVIEIHPLLETPFDLHLNINNPDTLSVKILLIEFFH